ncbi:MAG: T9SS type A sorting domain-containing protein, partial [Bacteroidota bacterium]
FYSFDNGFSWSSTLNPVQGFSISMSYFNGSVYTLTGQSLYKFDLTNLTWSYLGTTIPYSCEKIIVDTSGIYSADYSLIIKFPLQGGPYNIYSTTSIWHAAINNGNIFGVNDTDVFVSPLLQVPQWTTINTGLTGSIHQGIFAFNNSNVYLGGGKGVYRSQPPAYNWTYTGLFDKGLHELATYGDAVFAATHEKGICVLRNDTSVWDPVNFDLPKGNYDSTHIFAFYSLACSDSGVFTGGSTYPDFGLWYRPYSELDIQVSTGVNENESISAPLSIFPNPVSSALTVSFPSSSNQNIELRIYNTLGKQIYFTKEEITAGKFEKEINVEKLSDGIYFLQLKTKEGNLNRKIIINH